MSAPDIATPDQKAAFLLILAAIQPGTTLDADLIRQDAEHGAQIPGQAMGGLFKGTCHAGYVFPVGYTTSRTPSRRGAVIRRYERTYKDVAA